MREIIMVMVPAIAAAVVSSVVTAALCRKHYGKETD